MPVFFEPIFSKGCAVFAAAALISSAFAQSAATSAGLTNATQACAKASVGPIQGKQECKDLLTVLTSLTSDSRLANVLSLCSSTCYLPMRTVYIDMGACLKNYRPTLVANLQTDGVASPEALADKMLVANDIGAIFDFFCLRSQQGDYCYPMISQLAHDLQSATTAASVTDTVCSSYYNSGCCMTAMDTLSTTQRANISFTGSLATICPAMANVTSPTCVGFKARAATLSVTMSVTGLNCTAYLEQNTTFMARYKAALKLDLAESGVISAGFINVVSIYVANNGVCTVLVDLRANTDAETDGLSTAAASLNTATFDTTNQIGATAGVGAVTALGTPKVTATYSLGQSYGASETNSASLAAPSIMAVLAALMAWTA